MPTKTPTHRFSRHSAPPPSRISRSRRKVTPEPSGLAALLSKLPAKPAAAVAAVGAAGVLGRQQLRKRKESALTPEASSTPEPSSTPPPPTPIA